jgi:hypothetical protein
MKRVLLIVVAGVLLALPDPLFAAAGAIAISPPMADGAIAISQSMTIVRPGKYVVTRNITSASSAPVLTIAANNVQVNLNGFTLRHTGERAVVVADNVNSIVVDNGVIAADGSREGIRFTNVHQFVIRHLMVTKGGFNELGISLSGCETGSVEHNIVDGPFELSLDIVAGQGLRVEHNVFRNTDCEGGARLLADNSVFAENILLGCSSLEVGGSGNIVARNNLRAGLSVSGARNRIEQNTLSGLGFATGSSENMYSDNFAGSFSDLGTNNTSGGDNFMPNRM